MTAAEVMRALAKRHSEDVTIPECPVGPGAAWRIDLVALRRSWARWQITGYEIKVARSDFLRDTKLHEYRRFCHRLYIVAPRGVVDPSELPEGVGLQLVSQGGRRIYTRRKAAIREIRPEDELELLQAVLINRAPDALPAHAATHTATREERMAAWKQALEDRSRLGYRVSEAIHEQWRALERRAAAAERQVAGYQWLVEWLESRGIDPRSGGKWLIRSQIEQWLGDLPRDLLPALQRARKGLEDSISLIESLMQEGTR